MSKDENYVSIWFKREWFILTVIVLMGFAIRLYGINLPLIDSHQGRQVVTAMMARNLYEDNMNIFRTRLDVFGNVPGYIIMEFPLMHGITALFYYLFGVHEIIGRLVSVVFSIGAMFMMYGLARRFLSMVGAYAALVLYVFSPMNIYFSRAFMPESSMMFFMIGAIYLLLKWMDKQTIILYMTAIILAALACLTKPTAVFIFVPILAAWLLKYRWNLFKRYDFWVYMFLSIMPGLFWAIYANYFNTMNPCDNMGFGSNWLYLITARGFINLWFDPKFYIFVGGSIIILLLTPLGFIGTVIGIFCSKKKDRQKILYAWLAAIIAYFYILSGANSGHIYYHLPFLPVAAIFFGVAVEWITNKHRFIKATFNQKSFILLGIGLVLAGYGIGYFKYFNYMYSNRVPYVFEVAEIIKKHIPKNKCIIEVGKLSGMIAYYSHNKAMFFVISDTAIADLEDLRAHGVTAFVAMETRYGNPIPLIKEQKELWAYLNEKCKPIAVNDQYLIFDLRFPLNGENNGTA